MRFDDNGISGYETSIYSRHRIPRWKCRTPDDERNALRDRTPFLVHLNVEFAHRLVPQCRRRESLKFLIAGGDRLQRAICSVRARCLESHHVSLPRCMHRRVSDLKKTQPDMIKGFKQDACALFVTNLAPCMESIPGPGDQIIG